LSEFAAGLIRAECPNLKDKMHVCSAVINWQSRLMEVIDSAQPEHHTIESRTRIELSAEMQARIYVADDMKMPVFLLAILAGGRL
jgi:hypothetical protein